MFFLNFLLLQICRWQVAVITPVFFENSLGKNAGYFPGCGKRPLLQPESTKIYKTHFNYL